MIAPHSSATGMNSSGRNSPFSGWNQRTRASNARMRPVSRSMIGWKKTDNSSRWRARRSSVSISLRRTRLRVIEGSKKATRLRPCCLAWNSARSAPCMTESRSLASSGSTATPIEQPTSSRSSSIRTVRLSSSSRSLAIVSTSARLSASAATMNSSPPKRARLAPCGERRLIRAAISTSTRSPI